MGTTQSLLGPSSIIFLPASFSGIIFSAYSRLKRFAPDDYKNLANIDFPELPLRMERTPTMMDSETEDTVNKKNRWFSAWYLARVATRRRAEGAVAFKKFKYRIMQWNEPDRVKLRPQAAPLGSRSMVVTYAGSSSSAPPIDGSPCTDGGGGGPIICKTAVAYEHDNRQQKKRSPTTVVRRHARGSAHRARCALRPAFYRPQRAKSLLVQTFILDAFPQHC
ncbi:hypothetical protein K438DRAFT_1927680 [Mycena galopus ATCC 62051]|nr:hypothetical protein K438DRAFT_1927680 [Mycena galopus ATCC 62051]